MSNDIHLTGTAPGKIIAIHLSYTSPESSVGVSGGSVERPAGTELLAFEGEVALVIGTPSRRVPLEEGVQPRGVGDGVERPRSV